MIVKTISWLFIFYLALSVSLFAQIDIDIEDMEPPAGKTSTIGKASFLMSLSHEEWINMSHSVNLDKAKNYEFNTMLLFPFRDPHTTFNMHGGISMSYSNLHSNVSDWVFNLMGEYYLPTNYPNGFDYKKNRIVAGYLGIPLGFSIQCGSSKKKFFMANLGINTSILFFANSKIKYDLTKTKVKIRSQLTPYRFNAYASIGWRYIQLYGSYGLSPFFNCDKVPEIKNWATGIAVYF